jgi:NADH-quinone oxidoreductase subunit H
MAGWASRNKYSLLGGMRAIAQMVSYEIPLVLSAVVVVMATGSLSASKIVSQQEFLWFVFTPWGFTAFVIFFICALAETNRSPFDLPEAESEIIAGYFTEYSGFKFALFFLGEYIAMFAISGLAVTLFLGGGNGPGSDNAWIACGWFLAKLFALIAVMIWLRGTLPRLRVDQLMSFAWKFLLPLSLLNIFVTGAALHLLGGGDLKGLAKHGDVLFQTIYQANPMVVGALWIVSGMILYLAATGLDNLNRSKARPREKLYFE